jgi:hypothetical protein
MARMRWSALLLSAALAGGCGSGGDDPVASATPPEATRTATPAPTRAPDRATVHRARCAPGTGNCAAVTGRVIYVEAVDPDGDGDAHYVLAGGNVTAPGVSVIDVAIDLRPRRLPRPGELVSAAGPVYEGSHGQRQIQATEVNYQRRR